jgi:transposase-like protein
MKAMTKHRSHSATFKRQVAQEFIAGETLHGLSKRHDVSRQLIRIWVNKYEAGALDEDAQAADMLQEYEAKIAALERLGQDDGVRGRVDVEPDDVAQFVDEPRVFGKLEVAHAVRLEAVGAPDPLDGTEAVPRGFRHQGAGPVGCLAGRLATSVRATTRSAASAPSGLMREGRVLSRSKPPNPSSMKRSCQRQTQVSDVPVAA